MTVKTSPDEKNNNAIITITMNYPTYKAIEDSLLEKDIFFEDEIKDAMGKIFTSRVPKRLRDFIEVLYPPTENNS